jgi:hypothetical protein
LTALARPTRLACALLAACALAVPAAPAAAASPAPCWKTLLNEWYGGSIKHVYPLHCYHDAIAHLPLDVQVYSSAKQDIERALAQAIAAEKAQHRTITAPETVSNPVPSHLGPSGPSSTTTAPATTPTSPGHGGFSGAIRDITPGGPGSFPLPLLILGLLAILLVLAGIGGLLWRRVQSRRGEA